jgi:dephospho-CoA kinase
VLDVDALGHKAIETQKEAVFGRFGHGLKNADGTVNRQALGQRVFGNTTELAALEGIIHPAVNSLTEEWVARQSGSCVVNAALLFKSSVFSKFDFIILIKAPFLTRLLRARRRDKLPMAELLRRFASQKDFYPQYLSAKADIYKVENSGFFNDKFKGRINQILAGEGL